MPLPVVSLADVVVRGHIVRLYRQTDLSVEVQTPAGIKLLSQVPAGTFCANCHAASFANSRFPGHTNGSHNRPCFACHVTIPHGSGHMGMLVSVGTPPDGVKSEEWIKGLKAAK